MSKQTQQAPFSYLHLATVTMHACEAAFKREVIDSAGNTETNNSPGKYGKHNHTCSSFISSKFGEMA